MTPVNPEILAALSSGIHSEVASYVFYVAAAKKTEAGELRDLLESLALEEKQHFQVLERQHDSLVRSEKWISTADILKQDGLPEISEDMNQLHRGLLDEVAAASTPTAVLDIALRLEIDARDLFAKAVDMVDSEEGKKVFRQLVGFEEGHVKLITQMKEKFA